MQTISAVSSNVAVRGDSSPCSRGLWLNQGQSALLGTLVQLRECGNGVASILTVSV